MEMPREKDHHTDQSISASLMLFLDRGLRLQSQVEPLKARLRHVYASTTPEGLTSDQRRITTPTMYLHILDHAGHRLALLNTRKRLDHSEHAELVSSLGDQFRGVGVLSAHANLNQLPRFAGSGEIKTEHIPKQLRGAAFNDYLAALTRIAAPITKTGNLAPAWSSETCPRRVSKVTAEQRDSAAKLRGQGVTWRKVGEMVGLDQSTLRRAISARA